jgi:hypothetical protein
MEFYIFRWFVLYPTNKAGDTKFFRSLPNKGTDHFSLNPAIFKPLFNKPKEKQNKTKEYLKPNSIKGRNPNREKHARL